MAKEKFIIEPHFRLQEWVAEEKGYFKDEGLDYVFRETRAVDRRQRHNKGDKVGAMQTSSAAASPTSAAPAIGPSNVAASKGHGKLYGDVYQVATCGVFVPRIRR